MANFIEIANNVRSLVSMADDGELTEPLELSLANVEAEFDDKHDAIRAVMNELSARFVRRKAEADRLYKLARQAESHLDRLYDWLMTGMRAAGVKTIETDLYRTSIVNNGGKPAVKFDGDIATLPEEFRREKVEIILDRDAILDAHKRGEELPSGVTVERGQRLSLS